VNRSKMLVGTYPGTATLKESQGGDVSPYLDFVEVDPIFTAFPRVVNDLEFDFAELALVTFLQARAAGQPILLLPIVLLAMFHHGSIRYEPKNGRLSASDLPGRRVGVRSYSQTTGLWVRGILASDHGVQTDSVNWVVQEAAHVRTYVDPPYVERAPVGADLIQMLHNGEIAAAIIGPNQEFAPLIDDPGAAAAVWWHRHGVFPINHVLTVREDIARSEADRVSQVLGRFRESFEAAKGEAAGESQTSGVPTRFEGVHSIASLVPGLEMAIGLAVAQGLIPAPMDPLELFPDWL
jgi:4,5-dihydroxyphthalate decarboxylase